MSLSQSMSSAGRINTTHIMLMIAPRAISVHMELIMSISEYTATPYVAAKSPNPETSIEGMEAESAVETLSRLAFPAILSDL